MPREKLTDAQIERIKAVYAETGNITEAGKAVGVSRTTARYHVRSADGLADIRRQKRVEAIAAVAHERADFAELLADAREAYIRHLMQPQIIATADAKDSATIIGILTDKHQLVTGAATARTEARLHASLDADLSITNANDPEAAALARAYAARITHGARDASDVRVGREP